jgi:hypothetical protein
MKAPCDANGTATRLERARNRLASADDSLRTLAVGAAMVWTEGGFFDIHSLVKVEETRVLIANADEPDTFRHDDILSRCYRIS